MNAVLEKTIYQLTKINDLSAVRVDELLQLVNEHPYFAPAQLALTAKFRHDNNEQATQQLQKTALYFSNLNWLEYHIYNGELKKVDALLAAIPPKINQVPIASVEENKITKLVLTPEQPVPAIIPIAVADAPVVAIPTVETVNEIMQGIDKKRELSVSKIVPIQVQPDEEERQHAPEVAPDLMAYKNEVQEADDNEEDDEQAPTSNQVSNISSAFSSQLAGFKKSFSQPPAKDAKLDFEMEPYYTIDYFASQGIKADLTRMPQDKLTRQLLTFTDWLKKMKVVSPDPKDLGTDPELENAIKEIAQTSNEAKEIATETMAEVFVKQGKIDKAVQLYIKLSFLDPKKSSYFASKIQQLKGM
jgi:hypothetical protein